MMKRIWAENIAINKRSYSEIPLNKISFATRTKRMASADLGTLQFTTFSSMFHTLSLTAWLNTSPFKPDPPLPGAQSALIFQNCSVFGITSTQIQNFSRSLQIISILCRKSIGNARPWKLMLVIPLS